MPKIRKTEYEKLCLQLAEADSVRRVTIKKLKSTPEYLHRYLNDALLILVNNNKWVGRKNSKEEFSYFKLKNFVIHKTNPTLITKQGSVLFGVDLIWDYYDYNEIEKKECKEHVVISTFNDIENQVLNGRVITDFNEKKLLKDQLTKKKKNLEEELKSIKLEIAKI